MPELRIILLVVGVLFVAGIAGFEWWRSRGCAVRWPPALSRDDAPAQSRRAPHRRYPRSTSCATRELRSPIPCPSSNSPAPRNPGRGARSASRSPTKSPWTSHATAGCASEADADPDGRDNEPYIGEHDEISAVRIVEEQPVQQPKLVLAWPDENERRIVTLRVIPRIEPRFQGRGAAPGFQRCRFLARSARHLSPAR